MQKHVWKKLLSVLLACTLIVSVAVPALAAAETDANPILIVAGFT